jgi:hypothetical protein
MSNLTQQQTWVLGDVMDYLESRQDADDGMPNEEMNLLRQLREVFGDIK